MKIDVLNLPAGAAVQIMDDEYNLVTAYVLIKDPVWGSGGKYRVTTDNGFTYYERYVRAGDVLPQKEWMPSRRSPRIRALRAAANAGNA